MADLEREGARLWFQVDGTPGAPALLLLNSLGSTLDLWAPQLPGLLAHRRVIRFDWRGHGRSGASPGPYPIDLLGRDAVAVLDAAGAPVASVCGISLGGQVAAWLGIHARTRVDRLVLAATGARIGTEAAWNQRIAAVLENGTAGVADAVLSRWFTAPFREREPDLVAGFELAFRRCSSEGYAGCAAAVRDADLRRGVGTIAAPTLVVTGSADESTPPALGAELAAGIPGARLVELPAAHLVNVEAAPAFTAALTDFLGEQAAS